MKIKLLFLFILIGFLSYGQEYDSLDIRILDTTIIQEYSKQSAFTYIDKPIIEDGESWLEKLLRWIGTTSAKNPDFTIKPIFYLIMIGTFFIFLYFFSKTKFMNVFERKKSKKLLELSSIQEDIQNVDFKHLIQQAEETKQYRLAVRFNFNHLLQNLNTKKVIEWAEHKTNLDFIHEIKNNNFKTQFQSISTIYDYIWYGEQPIDEQGYTSYKHQISNLIQKIS